MNRFRTAAGAVIAAAALILPATANAAPVDNVNITASEHGSGNFGTMYVYDDEAFTPMLGASYTLHDGYRKVITGLGGVTIRYIDIANCGHDAYHGGTGFGHAQPNGGTGLPCHPRLHTQEVSYQESGTVAGRGDGYADRRIVTVTEQVHGSGSFLTVGHIDHGAMRQITYDFAGQHETIDFKGDVIVTRIIFEHEGTGGYRASIRRHHARVN